MHGKLLAVLLFFIAHLLSAQETTLAAGGEDTGTGGSSSYSIGQVFYNTVTDNTGRVSQGVQQSLELFVLSNPELTTLNLKVVTYPNPTSDYVVLSLSDSRLTDLSYVLYDLQGRLVSQNKIFQSSTKIDLCRFEGGVYVLKVNQNNQELKTFKIIKN